MDKDLKYDDKLNIAMAVWNDNDIRPNLMQFLDDSDLKIREAALSILELVSEQQPEAVKSFESKLIYLLDTVKERRAANITKCSHVLRNIAKIKPEVLDVLIPKLIDRLNDREELVRQSGQLNLRTLARLFPERIEPYRSKLANVLSD